MNESKFLTPEEVTERYRGGISVGTLRNWRAIRVGPSFVKVGKAVLYPISDLDAWDERIESHAERQRGSPKISVIERDGRGRASSTYLSSRHHIPAIEMLSSFFSITYMIKRSDPQSANAAYMPASNEWRHSCAVANKGWVARPHDHRLWDSGTVLTCPAKNWKVAQCNRRPQCRALMALMR